MIQLYHGDCLEEIRKIPDKSVDLVLTDPPYGIDFQSSWIKDKGRRKAKIENDKKPFTEFVKELPRVVKDTGAVVVFSRWDVQQAFIDEMERCGMKPKGVLIWDKGGGGMGDLKRAWALDYETAIYWTADRFEFQHGRPGSSVIKSAKVPPEQLTHPNEKPVDLLRFIISEMCVRGGTVMDCFMGSGSCGEAAKKSGRRFVGIELDNKYFEMARRRIEEQREQIDMLSMLEGT